MHRLGVEQVHEVRHPPALFYLLGHGFIEHLETERLFVSKRAYSSLRLLAKQSRLDRDCQRLDAHCFIDRHEPAVRVNLLELQRQRVEGGFAAVSRFYICPICLDGYFPGLWVNFWTRGLVWL